MIEKITDEEIEYMECFYNPLCMAESVFSDYDNMSIWEEDKEAHVRFGQFPLLSYEYLIDYDPKLSSKQNFKLREGAGNLWCLGGRRFGKTLFVEIVDALISMLILSGEHVGFTSLDALHIRGVLEKLVEVLENHTLFKIFKPKINRSPNYRFYLRNGYVLESVNMNLQSKNPGAQFFQKHFSRLYIEEASFETETIYNKRLDSVSENGCVMRVAGMTNFTKYSPVGRTFYDLKLKTWICNLPQYVNPKWDDTEKAKAIKEHGGENSPSYRIFVKGEVVEEGVSVFDMDRVRKCYNDKHQVKVFEITKENFLNFKNIIVVEKPKNAEVCYVCSDIGESASSEIVIIFKVNNKYKYIYNIILYNLTDKEQFQIFSWLASILNANFIGLDTTDGTGRAIFRSLAEVLPKENLVWVAFNEKIVIDFEKDNSGNVIIKNGLPVEKHEFISEWSIKHLKDLLYGELMDLPLDYKLDIQLNSVIATQSGNRTIYSCVSQENHLFQAFQVFSISQWFNEFNSMKPIRKKTFSKTGF